MTLKREVTSGAQFLDEINNKYGTELNANATPSMLLSAFKVGSESASYNKTDDNVIEIVNEDEPSTTAKVTIDLGQGEVKSTGAKTIELTYNIGDTFVSADVISEYKDLVEIKSQPGYVLHGFMFSGTGSSTLVDSFTVTEDVSLSADYAEAKVTLTLDLGEATVGTGSVTSHSIQVLLESGSTYTLTDPTSSLSYIPDGMVYAGWSELPDGQGSLITDDTITVVSDKTIYLVLQSIRDAAEYWDGVSPQSVRAIVPPVNGTRKNLSNDSDWAALVQEYHDFEGTISNESFLLFTDTGASDYEIRVRLGEHSIGQIYINVFAAYDSAGQTTEGTIAEFEDSNRDGNLLVSQSDIYESSGLASTILYNGGSLSSGDLPHLGPVVLKLLKFLK